MALKGLSTILVKGLRALRELIGEYNYINPLLQMRQVILREVKSFSELVGLDMVFGSRLSAPSCYSFSNRPL